STVHTYSSLWRYCLERTVLKGASTNKAEKTTSWIRVHGVSERFEARPLLASRPAELRDSADIVVLTLLRGMVPVGYEVARALVVQLPRSKRRIRCFTARLAAPFDAAIHVDQTRALEPPRSLATEAGRRGAGNLSVAA